MSRSKYWCFTLNNYTNEEEENIRTIGNADSTSYMVWGREIGENQTPHLQGYVEFSTRLRLPQVKRLLGNRVHLESRRGTAEEAAIYCKKDGDSEEFGVISAPSPGRRTDLETVVQEIRSGTTLRELWSNHTSTMIRYSKGIRQAMMELMPIQEHAGFDLDSFPFHPLIFQQNRSVIIWGQSGARKTSYVTSRFPRICMVSHMDDLLNFKPDEHDGILFDDMDFKHIPRTAQIHLVDVDFDRSIHIRYTTVTIPKHTLKIFTTNEDNGDIFLNDPAINRRIQKIHIITNL